MPAYKVNHIVKRICPDGNHVDSVVREVFENGLDIDTFRNTLLLHGYSHEYISAFIVELTNRDPDWLSKPIYIIEPLSSPGFAALPEAKSIVPGITDEQYGFLKSLSENQIVMLYSRRMFIALDSELV